MHCTNCGAPLAESAKFCTSCGAAREVGPVSAPAPEKKSAASGLGHLVGAAIALILGIFLVCDWLVFSAAGSGDVLRETWGIFNLQRCGKFLHALGSLFEGEGSGIGGGFFAVLALIAGIIALIAVLGAIITLVTKNDLGWTLFRAACVLVIVVFLCSFLYFLICNGSETVKAIRASYKEAREYMKDARLSFGVSFGGWASLVIAAASLVGVKKLKSL